MYLPAPSAPMRHIYWIVSNIHLIDCSQETVACAKGIILFTIHPACHLDANGIKPGSISRMTDKHAAEQWKTCVFRYKLIRV